VCALFAACAGEPDTPDGVEHGETGGRRAESSAAIGGSAASAGLAADAGSSSPMAAAGTLASAAGTKAQTDVPAGRGGGGGTESGGQGNAGSSPGSATAGSSVAGNTSQAGTAGMHADPWKVMMLGDSIVASTCYPQLVSKGLIDQGHTSFAFVGTQTNNQSCNASHVMDEGHGGYGVTYLPQNSMRGACQKPACGTFEELQSWAAQAPELVIMHYGTNDVWDGQPTDSILAAYSAVIAEFRKHNPSLIFFVSKIIKLDPMGCANCLRDVASLTAALTDSWAAMNTTPTSPVWIVDDYASGFDPDDSSDTSDGVHPTPSGSQKMADATIRAVTAKNYF
jgi:acyl-CoA thioesterase-1